MSIIVTSTLWVLNGYSVFEYFLTKQRLFEDDCFQGCNEDDHSLIRSVCERASVSAWKRVCVCMYVCPLFQTGHNPMITKDIQYVSLNIQILKDKH